jgi:hypothetical protein
MRSKKKIWSPNALSPTRNLAQEAAVESTEEEFLPELEEDHLTQEELLEEDEFEETAEAAPQANPGTDEPEDYEIEPVIDEPSVDDDLAEPAKRQDESEDKDADASASHRFDPHSPSGFRLFGFGKKKGRKSRPAKIKLQTRQRSHR